MDKPGATMCAWIVIADVLVMSDRHDVPGGPKCPPSIRSRMDVGCAVGHAFSRACKSTSRL